MRARRSSTRGSRTDTAIARRRVGRGTLSAAILLASAVAIPGFAFAEPAGTGQQDRDTADWRLTLSNEIGVEHYDVDGAEDASPFRFTGTFWTDRLSLKLERDDPFGRNFVLDVEALGADNPYLADDGGVLELLRFELEDGSTGVPYRVGAGDVYTDFSRRTLQRSLRGGSLEVQPQFGFADQSILFASGSGEPGWNETFGNDPEELFFTGLSYLLAAPSGDTVLVANLVNAQQTTVEGARFRISDAASGAGGSDGPPVSNDHTVESLYAETRVGPLRLEGEFARYSGERGADGAEDVSDRSFYAQVAQHGGPFSWRLRYEDNGEDFLPVGAVGVIANRRIGEFHGRARLGRGGTLRGRIQLIESDFQGDDPSRRTDLFGLDWDVRPLVRRPSLRLRVTGDLNVTRVEDGLVDRRFASLSLRVQDRIGRSLPWRYRLTVRDTDDRIVEGAGISTVDHGIRASRRFRVDLGGHDLDLEVGGGLLYRSQEGTSEFTTWSPTIDLSGRSGPHRVALHLSFLEQGFVRQVVEDLEYRTRRLTYSYVKRPHELRFELGQENRRPEGFEETDSLRVAVRYRFTFELDDSGDRR